MSRLIKEKVKTLEKTNRLVTENLVDAVWVVDAGTLEYEYITPSVQKISGYGPNELIGTPVFERLLPESSAKATALLVESLTDYEAGKQASRTMELELRHKQGGSYWVEIRAKLVEEGDGPPKIVGITRDVTQRKQAEQELERINQELREALAEKERMAAEIKQLQKLLPICSACRRIRDESGRWWPLEEYIRTHTDADFSHTICPDCKDIYYWCPGLLAGCPFFE